MEQANSEIIYNILRKHFARASEREIRRLAGKLQNNKAPFVNSQGKRNPISRDTSDGAGHSGYSAQ